MHNNRIEQQIFRCVTPSSCPRTVTWVKPIIVCSASLRLPSPSSPRNHSRHTSKSTDIQCDPMLQVCRSEILCKGKGRSCISHLKIFLSDSPGLSLPGTRRRARGRPSARRGSSPRRRMCRSIDHQ